MSHDTTQKKIEIGDIVLCKNSLPFGRSGNRKILRIADGHSIYVKLTNEDSAYQNRAPHQDFWQVMWEDFQVINHP